tara:strand:+ start:445 stop:585 length:141 start_codon:yes stop_codon:yes gene_type:complete
MFKGVYWPQVWLTALCSKGKPLMYHNAWLSPAKATIALNNAIWRKE